MIKDKLIPFLILLFCSVILLLTLHGVQGNPTAATINDAKWADNGPFELSPDRGRFALTYSLIEDHSFFFSVPVARFATPDLGYKNGHYVSLFAPLVSYVIIPGYMLGKLFGIAQVGSFSIIAFFAVVNVLLIRSIAIRLGAHSYAASLAGCIFLFATPAFPYAVTLYQHHISTFLILMSLYSIIRWKNMWSLFFVWFLFATSLPMDNPNLFLMFPLVIYSVIRLFSIESKMKNVAISFKLKGLLTFLGVVVPLAYFMWFNQMSYGSPFQLGGTVASVKAIDHNGNPAVPTAANVDKNTADVLLNPEKQNKSVISFFHARNLINGFYEHFISQDRGILFFTPIMFAGLIGFIVLYKRNATIVSIMIGIIGMDILLYSMWGDPYGGWAFGSRYLIPAYAILSLFIAFTLSSIRKNIMLLILFCIVLTYSICVNTLGAVTSNRNPPKIEVLALEKLYHAPQEYSYDINIRFLTHNASKSFIWQTYTKNYLSAVTYYWLLIATILSVFGVQIAFLYIKNERSSK